MPLATYNFETHIEAGFKAALLAFSEITARTPADDHKQPFQGEIDGEQVILTCEVGASLSNEHLNIDSELDHFNSVLSIAIQTPRLDSSQTPAPFIQDRHDFLIASVRRCMHSADGVAAVNAAFIGALVDPVKILPTASSREANKTHHITTLIFALQFKVLPASA